MRALMQNPVKAPYLQAARLAAVLAVSISHPAVAQGQDSTGNSLYADCTNGPASAIGFCYGRVQGFMLGWEMASGETSANVFCRPAGTTMGQTGDIIVKYLREHPEQRHADWRPLILLALNQAWPCEGGKTVVWQPPAGIRVLPPHRHK